MAYRSVWGMAAMNRCLDDYSPMTFDGIYDGVYVFRIDYGCFPYGNGIGNGEEIYTGDGYGTVVEYREQEIKWYRK